MINYIWSAFVVISVVFAAFCGNMNLVSQGAIDGAKQAIELLFTIGAMMCLWSGIMNIAENTGITRAVSKLFAPLMRVLMPDYKGNKAVTGAVCSNITANLLGLGNAATPLGLEAMRRMKEGGCVRANNSMIIFVILNTASIQLVPATVAALRQSAGAQSPFNILPCVWISSAFALFLGIASAKAVERLT